MNRTIPNSRFPSPGFSCLPRSFGNPRRFVCPTRGRTFAQRTCLSPLGGAEPLSEYAVIKRCDEDATDAKT